MTICDVQIRGKTIYYDGSPLGTITPPEGTNLYHDLRTALEERDTAKDAGVDAVYTRDDLENAETDAYDEGYVGGYVEGYQRAIEDTQLKAKGAPR